MGSADEKFCTVEQARACAVGDVLLIEVHLRTLRRANAASVAVASSSSSPHADFSSAAAASSSIAGDIAALFLPPPRSDLRALCDVVLRVRHGQPSDRAVDFPAHKARASLLRASFLSCDCYIGDSGCAMPSVPRDAEAADEGARDERDRSRLRSRHTAHVAVLDLHESTACLLASPQR